MTTFRSLNKGTKASTNHQSDNSPQFKRKKTPKHPRTVKRIFDFFIDDLEDNTKIDLLRWGMFASAEP